MDYIGFNPVAALSFVGAVESGRNVEVVVSSNSGYPGLQLLLMLMGFWLPGG